MPSLRSLTQVSSFGVSVGAVLRIEVQGKGFAANTALVLLRKEIILTLGLPLD